MEEFIQSFIRSAIETPELRDELFVQLIKQVTAPKEVPKMWDQLLVNGWQVLTLAAASFPASKALAKYLLGYIRRTVDDFATQDKHPVRKLALAAEEAVKRVIMNGPRKYPPSVMEITILKTGGILPCRFSLIDGRELDIAGGLTTTAGDVVKEIARKIELKDATGWSLYEVTVNKERAIKRTEYIADFIAAWEGEKDGKKKDAGGTIRKKKGEINITASEYRVYCYHGALLMVISLFDKATNIDVTLIMKKRVFRDVHGEITDPTEYALLYAQAVDGVAKDIYPMNEKVAMQLAALRAQVLLGDCDAASAEARL